MTGSAPKPGAVDRGRRARSASAINIIGAGWPSRKLIQCFIVTCSMQLLRLEHLVLVIAIRLRSETTNWSLIVRPVSPSAGRGADCGQLWAGEFRSSCSRSRLVIS